MVRSIEARYPVSMCKDIWTDYPVIVVLSLSGAHYMLETKASILDRSLPLNWPEMSAQGIQEAVWAALKRKIWLGPIETPDKVGVALDEFRAEGWYVIGMPRLSQYALTSRAMRYPPGRVSARSP